MNLYIVKDTFAFASRAKYADSSKGPDKTLSVASPASGTWYIGVECATTVTATKRASGYEYSGKLGVLNGVKYSIKADWTGGSNIQTKNNASKYANDQLWVKSAGKEVVIQIGNSPFNGLRVYDVKGRLCWQPTISQTNGIYTWLPENGGLYLVRLADKKDVKTKCYMAVK